MAVLVPCPYCAEPIQPRAAKCRFCREFLGPDHARGLVGVTADDELIALDEQRGSDRSVETVAASVGEPPNAVNPECCQCTRSAAEHFSHQGSIYCSACYESRVPSFFRRSAHVVASNDNSLSDGRSAEYWATLPRPWRRYFARLIDTLLGSFTVGLGLYLLAPDTYADMMADHNTLILLLVSGVGIVLLEGISVALSGETPGKMLFGLRVELADGRRPPISVALSRAYKVWWYGRGAGVPIASLCTMLHARTMLERDGRTSWDKALGTRVVKVR